MISTNNGTSKLISPVTLSSIGVSRSHANVLQMVGKDSIDLLHRISTNSLLDMQSNSAKFTILTTEKGRIVDLILVQKIGSAEALVYVSPGQASKIKAWIEKFIIMDDVQVTEVSAIYSMVTVLFSKGYSSNDLDRPDSFDGISLICLADPFWKTKHAYRVCGRKEHVERYLLGFPSITELTAESYDELRILEGIPVHGKELNEQFNPLEAGLSSFISFSKGCYVGQEVIARIDTYKKLQKSLYGFFVNSSERYDLVSDSKIYLREQIVGVVTSQRYSEMFQKGVALGLLDSDIQESEFELQVGGLARCKIQRREIPSRTEAA